MADDREPVGDSTTTSTLWPSMYRIGAVLVALAAVPYALVVVAAPLQLAAAAILPDLGLPSATTLARALGAAVCGALAAAAVGAAVVVRRVAPPWAVLAGGMAALAAGAVWVRSVHSVGQLAVVRGLQGVGAGLVLVAVVAVVASLSSRMRALMTGTWLVAMVAGSSVLPWATYRLPFVVGTGWRDVVAPYPAVFVVALAGTAAVAVAALAGREGRPGEYGGGVGDETAGRLGWPLVLPAGIAAAVYLLKPGWMSAPGGQVLTLFALLLLTVLAVVVLTGLVLARPFGWRAGVTLPVATVVGTVLAVTASNTFNVALFTDARWPLPTGHVLPALGGSALVGAAGCVAGVVSPVRLRRNLAAGGLLVAFVGVLLPLSTGVAVTTVGTMLVFAGAGLALGSVVEWTGVASGAWAGGAVVVATSLAGTVSTALRTVLTPADNGGADRLRVLHDGFTEAQRITIAACAVLLAVAYVLVARSGRPVVGEVGAVVDSPAEPGDGAAGEPETAMIAGREGEDAASADATSTN